MVESVYICIYVCLRWCKTKDFLYKIAPAAPFIEICYCNFHGRK